MGFAEEAMNAARKSAYKQDPIFYTYLGGLLVLSVLALNIINLGSL